MEPCALVDAGPLVGWFNARDQWHEWSVRVLRQVKGPLHTTEIVLGEALWHLGGNTRPAHALLDLVRRRAVVMLRPWPTLLGRSQELMLKYPLMDAGMPRWWPCRRLTPAARSTRLIGDISQCTGDFATREFPARCRRRWVRGEFRFKLKFK